VTLAPQTETLLRLAAALVVLGLCFVAHRSSSRRRAALYLVAFTSVYLMLFNPRTENNTYCVLGPALAAFLIDEASLGRRYRTALLAIFVAGCTAGYEIGKYFTPVGARPMWMAPLCCTLFAVYLIRRLAGDWLEHRRGAEIDGAVVELPERRAA
jgi:hypothetical protein